MSQPAPDRLDSWKAIADFLKRDVRTVHRWEKSLSLPVRRIPGQRGHSVFAYVSEIEAWMKTSRPDALAAPAARPDWRTWRWLVAAAAVLAIAGIVWGVRSLTMRESLEVRITPAAVVAADVRGAERWRYPFSLEAPATPVSNHQTSEWLSTGQVLVGTSHRLRAGDNTFSSGQLLWLTSKGRLERTFSFDDHLAFGAGEYDDPWLITDFRIAPNNSGLVAVAARHLNWWPSLVTVLDAHGARRGTFVNAGWIESLLWMAPGRLLIGGFSNLRDGGTIALLDTDALDGQSPAPADSPFYCKSCGAGAPLRYVTLPRSELNRVTGSRFNRVTLEPKSGNVLARSMEASRNGSEYVEAFYEFSPSLDVVRASYSDHYWQLHRELETEGRIAHTRASCPERDGPTQLDVWDRGAGWRTVRIAK